ncbi:Hypothetical protein, putative [Bodo saltans]|uniref:Thioredoxin domain-containing protein n=1 Tax=Bodo saltans TaxID=75058 RepID=A0A0S4IKJ9_BODSA|nr:Hypothetical protein, putative [Bodo saltans]|eukprot:CUE66530.1 Hypothetical protein, putative [Bodo saltans]
MTSSLMVPSGLDRNGLVEAGLVESDPRHRHLFVVLFVASWTSKSNAAAMRDVHHFAAMARRYDNTNNAVTASFTIVDLHSTRFGAGSALHNAFLGGDTSIGFGDVCLDPPCVFTCSQLTAQRDARHCGGQDLPFNFLPTALDFDALERSLTLAGNPTSDEETNLRPLDAMSRSLQAAGSRGVVQLDSLRPWLVLDRDAALAPLADEGRKTLAADALAYRRNVVVLFHGGQQLSANGIWYDRRVVKSFESICKTLNLTTTTTSQESLRQENVCAVMNSYSYAKLAHHVKTKFHRTSQDHLKQSAIGADSRSPFIALLSRMDIAGDDISSEGDLPMATSDMSQRRMVLDITPEMLILNPSKVETIIATAIGKQHAHSEDREAIGEGEHGGLTTVTANQLFRTITDPERGVLMLYSGGSSCPHSAQLRAVMVDVAKAFVRERREVTIAVIDGSREIDVEERKNVYGVTRLPMLLWYPKGIGKHPLRTPGEEYRGLPQKLPLIEYVNDEMGYSFFEMDWMKDTTVRAVTRRDWDEKIGGPRARNRSHTVLFLYRTLQQDAKTAEMLLDLEKRLGSHVDFERSPVTRPNDEEAEIRSSEETAEAAASGLIPTIGGIEFFKMDSRRFEGFLKHQGLIRRGVSTEARILAKRAMKVEHAVATSDATVVHALDIIEMASFVLRSVDEERYGTDAQKVLRFTSQEVAHHQSTAANRHDSSSFAGDAPSSSDSAADLGKDGKPRPLVTELDMHDFRSFVDDAEVDAVVFFYATWCEQSKIFEPKYLEAAKHFGSSDKTIRFGKINVPLNDETGHGQGILSFPTVKFYFAGSKDKAKLIGAQYHSMGEFLEKSAQPNATQNFIQYIANTRRSTKVQELDHQRLLVERALLELNETSLQHAISNTTDQYLVEFYAPWCGHCRTVIPELQAVGEYFRRQRRMNPIRPRLHVARIDATKYRNASAALNATNSYPTILLLTNEKNAKGTIVRRVHKYNDHRLAERIIDFVSIHLPKVATDHDGRKKAKPAEAPSKKAPATKTSTEKPPRDEELNLPRLETEEQKKQDRDKRKRSVDDAIEDLYATDEDLKEVIRKRNVQKKTKSGGARQIKVIERSKLLSRHVQFLDEKTLRGFLDTTTVVVVLNCESKVDAEHLEAWNIVAENFEQLIKHRLVVVGVVEAGDSTAALRGMLGEAPSITVFRGLATPQIARYKMLDPYEDHDEYAKIRFGQGGSGTNATEVVEFVKQQIHNTLMHSVEFKTVKEFDAATQNRSAKIMVMFYAPWSEDAKAIAPHYDGLAQQYRHMNNVFITRLDVSQHLKVHERMRRTKLPFFLVYDDIPEDVREQMNAKDRKIPRILTTPRPTRTQLGAFLLNQVQPEADRDWVGEWFVPYGDESHIPPLVKYTSEVDDNEVVKSAHAEWNAFQRRTHQDVDDDVAAPSSSATAIELSSWRPLLLNSVDEVQTFVTTFGPTRGALIFFSSNWCKHCFSQYRTFLAGAAKVSSTVAVAMFNVSRTEDSKKLKSSPFEVSVFPTVLFFGGTGADARVEFTEKLRGPHAASTLVKFIATTTARIGLAPSASHPLPTYPSAAQAGSDQPSTTHSSTPRPASVELPQELSTVEDVTASLSRFMNISSTGSPTANEGGAAIIFLNASWCTHVKCGTALEAVVASTVMLTKPRRDGATAIRPFRWNLSDKRVKAFANANLGIVAVPTVVIACNGSAHRFPHDVFPSSPSAASLVPSRIVAFAEEVCFGLLPLELQRKRLQDALEEAEEGAVTRMSVASLISPESGDNIFAMRFNGSTCSRDPHCIEATRLMRLLSGTYKNRQLLFASVDMALPENEDKSHRDESASAQQVQQHRTGSVRLVYYPAEQPPVPYEGELERSELIAFLDIEERRSRDSHRRI